ncbi:MAG: hypothetical protein KF884_10820 [Fimbriimonadaceae bacterium]|nr:hypothetical protein [Fimbriimonadaceae bacterium]QYK58039.1 MAG: hypothetical protein KF884_10820 [Fimbriimonadaceae bacterium]
MKILSPGDFMGLCMAFRAVLTAREPYLVYKDGDTVGYAPVRAVRADGAMTGRTYLCVHYPGVGTYSELSGQDHFLVDLAYREAQKRGPLVPVAHGRYDFAAYPHLGVAQ